MGSGFGDDPAVTVAGAASTNRSMIWLKGIPASLKESPYSESGQHVTHIRLTFKGLAAAVFDPSGVPPPCPVAAFPPPARDATIPTRRHAEESS
jgi:hypothetical protein